MNAIFQRRSIRKYKNKPVEKEKIELLLRAAMQAPSAGNQQPWEFIVVENKETLKSMSNVSQYSKMLTAAPLAIVMLANKSNLHYPEYWEQDMGAATQNLLIESADLGLGSVWLGIAPLKDRIDFMQSLFQLPENIIPFAVVPVGYPAEELKAADRFKKNKIHLESFS